MKSRQVFILAAILLLADSGAASEGGLAAAIPHPRPPAQAEGASRFYLDDQGLYVSTTGAALEHPLWNRFWLRVKAVADLIVIDVASPSDSADPHAGHDHGGNLSGGNPGDVDAVHVDGISGASVRAGGVGGSRELRAEGSIGLVYRGSWKDRPLEMGFDLHASHEPDYQGFGGVGSAKIDWNQGNTALVGHVGAAMDRITPVEAPHGYESFFPAYQSKFSAGLSLSQILTRRLDVSGGFSCALQAGRMSSPYRRAQVNTTLYPERLPNARLRATAFLQGAYYLGARTALHLRQGAYADDWGVMAYIPETALAKEIGSRFLATLRHRYYVQTSAEFYRVRYAELETIRAGDIRLGRLDEQTLGATLEWKTWQYSESRGPLVLSLGYDFSWLDYWDGPGKNLVSQVIRLGGVLDY